MSLLAGPVIFIDDQLDDITSQAAALLSDIKGTGRPVTTAKAIPENPEAWAEHWQGLAFAVIDWDLSDGSGGALGAAMLSEHKRLEMFDFVSFLMKRIYCPIFIISAEDVADITNQISENEKLAPGGEIDRRIMIFSKSVLMENINDHFAKWMSQSPALIALDAWSSELDRARSGMLIDLNAEEPDWPVYIWRAALKDGDGEGNGVDPSYELANVINMNLVNRFNPVDFDEPSLTAAPLSLSAETRQRVSQGRTSVPSSRLSEKMVRPGDIFVLEDAKDGEVWINVSPACHTVGRTKKVDGVGVKEPITLHLIKGERLERPTSNSKLSSMEKVSPNSAVIHTVIDSFPFRFHFGEAKILDWEQLKSQRRARLLPPFITRIQQLHAAYIQSEGLPRVTIDMYVTPSQ